MKNSLLLRRVFVALIALSVLVPGVLPMAKTATAFFKSKSHPMD
jgi:hypothetical protein